ncbi:MAG: hypothetical protein QM490_03405 [Candidatus Gracilibacteria bacterium]
MKKNISLLIGFILLFIPSLVSANTGNIVSTGVIEEISYLYYYGQGCSHCANVDEYMNAVDGYEKLNIEKYEIYFDDDNREKYLAAGKRLGLSEKELGIPFLIIIEDGKEAFLTGDVSIINYFKGYLGEAPENPNKKIILIIMGIFVVLIPVFLIKSSK